MANILLIVNIGLGLALTYMQIACWMKIRNKGWAWVRMASGCIGLGWAVIYGVLLYQSIFHIGTPSDFIVFVTSISRPAMTITLAVMLSNVIISKRVR